MTIIAIPTNNSDVFSETPRRTQNASYVNFVKNAGYTPILVPMEADPNEIAEIADGLLLAGGIDVDPMYYGFSNQASSNVDSEKDAAERALLHAFKAKNKKVFGICRGMQLIFREYMLAVADKKESLFFDYIENIGGHAQTGALRVRRSTPTHYVKANMSGLFNTDMKPRLQMLPVNSMHHQVCVFNHGLLNKQIFAPKVDKIASFPKGFNRKEPFVTKVNNFDVLAWSLRSVEKPKNDKNIEDHWSIIEAFSIDNWGGGALAVQWHPEELGSVELLVNFMEKTEKTVVLNEMKANVL